MQKGGIEQRLKLIENRLEQISLRQQKQKIDIQVMNQKYTMMQSMEVNNNMKDKVIFIADKDSMIYEWLNQVVKLPQYYDKLLQNGFDNVEFIKDITKADLIQIGIDKLGHQKRILNCINELK